MHRHLLVAIARVAGALIFLQGAQVATADGQVAFSPTLPAKSHCVVEIAAVHPTEIALGMREVEMRAKVLHYKTPEELAKYLNKHITPIVIGPDGVPYAIDNEHLARALLLAGFKSPLPAVIEANWSDLSAAEFWDKMKAAHWIYLYDENGKGPLPVTALPQSIVEMRDDPYRSLAWLVRQRSGYRKTEDKSGDFTWANFFRNQVPLENAKAADEATVSNAVVLAHSPAAKDLPGYIVISPKSPPAKSADSAAPKPAQP